MNTEQITTIFRRPLYHTFGIFDALSGRISDEKWGILSFEEAALASAITYRNLCCLEKSYISLMASLDFLARVKSVMQGKRNAGSPAGDVVERGFVRYAYYGTSGTHSRARCAK
jgi:hypothetical protein